MSFTPIPTFHELTRIDKYLDSWLNRTQLVICTVRSEFLQFLGLSGIRLKIFELFKTLAKNSPIQKIVRDSYLRPKAFLDIVT